MAILLTTTLGCARARIVAEMEITGEPVATGIGQGITGKINGKNYVFLPVSIQKRIINQNY
jgi:hypothetical protein